SLCEIVLFLFRKRNAKKMAQDNYCFIFRGNFMLRKFPCMSYPAGWNWKSPITEEYSYIGFMLSVQLGTCNFRNTLVTKSSGAHKRSYRQLDSANSIKIARGFNHLFPCQLVH